MGRDKAELTYGVLPQWQRLADLLAPLCTQVYWSCSAKQKRDWGIGERGLTDKVPGHGPASGLHAAFSSFEPAASAWLVVACDYPFLETRDLEQLVAARDGQWESLSFHGETADDVEPMIALWEPAAQKHFLEAFARGEDSARRILKETRWKGVQSRDAFVLRNRNRDR